MSLQQSFYSEMFAGNDAEASYTPDGRFVVKFTAYWSRHDKEKLGFDCVVWGNKTTSENPTPDELGVMATYASCVKSGDRILVRRRIKGTESGKPRTWEDREKRVHAAYLELVVFELSITQAKADRPAKPSSASMPVAEEETGEERLTRTPVTAPTTVQLKNVFTNYVSKIQN